MIVILFVQKLQIERTERETREETRERREREHQERGKSKRTVLLPLNPPLIHPHIPPFSTFFPQVVEYLYDLVLFHPLFIHQPAFEGRDSVPKHAV